MSGHFKSFGGPGTTREESVRSHNALLAIQQPIERCLKAQSNGRVLQEHVGRGREGERDRERERVDVNTLPIPRRYWWRLLFPRLRGFQENVQPLISRLCIFPPLKWRFDRAHLFHPLGQDQSTVAQRAETTVTECSLTRYRLGPKLLSRLLGVRR